MAELIQSNQINTIIVLRNDTKEAWEASSSYILASGEVGVGYMTVTVKDANGTVVLDPETTEPVTKRVPIVKIGDGVSHWSDLKQTEKVFTEESLRLTQTFGRHAVGTSGYVDIANVKGKTMSEVIIDAFKQSKNPSVTYPTCSMTVSVSPSGTQEVGTAVTSYSWDGSFSAGSYQYGSNTNSNANSTAGTTVTWKVIPVGGSAESAETAQDKSNIAVTGYKYEDTANTLSISAEATLNLPASDKYIPYDNIQDTVGSLKINRWATGITGATYSNNNLTVSLTPSKSFTGSRKCFYSVRTAPIDRSALTNTDPNAGTTGSAIVRGMNKVDALPSGASNKVSVPVGSREVVFFAKHGKYSKLVANDTAAQNAEVSFDKVTNAVEVEGANGYTAVYYDMWIVTWADPIASAKSLQLTWS